MSRTRKHRDIFFLRFVNRVILQMGFKFTRARTVRWVKVRDRVFIKYGNKHRLDRNYNDTPYHRAEKRTARFQAVKQAKLDLELQDAD